MSESTRVTAIAPSASFRPFVAPRRHGSAFIDPSLPELGGVLEQNRAAIRGWNLELAGVSIQNLRRTARVDLIRAATKYVRAYRDVPEISGAADVDRVPMLMSGHQPELFHPGVWFKNFVLSQTAARLGTVAINLIVDNDLSGTAAVAAPTLDGGRITRQAIPFDGPALAAIPFEQRWITDQTLFESFPQRLSQAVRGIVSDPCVDQLWPHAIAAARRCANIGCSIAQARHSLEGDLGLQTLELPISVACRIPAYSTFMLALLNELPRLHTCYNETLAEYRRAHSIRSTAHPVPGLSERDGWLEAPLWIYGDDDPRRRAAWARMSDDRLEISDLAGRAIRIESPESSSAAEQLLAAQTANFKLRPRALVTTMFARLVLSDLFFHGIGGAKYDQLGDLIIERFFGVQPPAYSVLSATVLLPGAAMHQLENNSPDSVRSLKRLRRDLDYHPEVFADDVALPEPLLARKRALLESIPPRGEKREWHRQVTLVNDHLSSYLPEQNKALARRLIVSQKREREQQLWQSREHPFPVYSLDYLTEIFANLV